VDAARVFEVANDLERAVVGLKTLFAGRAADAGVWRENGHKSAASWMAETSGTGLSEVNGMLVTSERLRSLPETTEALRRGELSGPQASVRECPLAGREESATTEPRDAMPERCYCRSARTSWTEPSSARPVTGARNVQFPSNRSPQRVNSL
jgi:hypothetical protein